MKTFESMLGRLITNKTTLYHECIQVPYPSVLNLIVIQIIIFTRKKKLRQNAGDVALSCCFKWNTNPNAQPKSYVQI